MSTKQIIDDLKERLRKDFMSKLQMVLKDGYGIVELEPFEKNILEEKLDRILEEAYAHGHIKGYEKCMMQKKY